MEVLPCRRMQSTKQINVRIDAMSTFRHVLIIVMFEYLQEEKIITNETYLDTLYYVDYSQPTVTSHHTLPGCIIDEYRDISLVILFFIRITSL